MKGKQQTKSSELRGRIQSKHTEMSARSALRRLAAPVRGTRNMSSGHSHEEEVAEMAKWKNVTLAVVPACVALGAYMMTLPHAHGPERIAFPYLRIRNKEFPWGPNGLFEHVPKEGSHGH